MNITPQDVGRKVVHRNGEVTMIIGFNRRGAETDRRVGGVKYWIADRTKANSFSSHSHEDIIAFLDEFDATDWEKLTEEVKRKMAKPGEKKMKHVIAGEADESVIEWRMQLLGSIPTLEARVKGEDAWFEIAYPCENKFYVETDTLRTLGFTEFDFD